MLRHSVHGDALPPGYVAARCIDRRHSLRAGGRPPVTDPASLVSGPSPATRKRACAASELDRSCDLRLGRMSSWGRIAGWGPPPAPSDHDPGLRLAVTRSAPAGHKNVG